MLYILCGLPFAGKSTLGREVARVLHIEIVEIDAINTARGLIPTSPQEWDETYSESYRQLETLLSARLSAVYDATNFTREQRHRLRTIAHRHGALTKVLYLNVPPDEARARWQRNRQTGQRYDVKDEDFANVLDNFQPPTNDENVVCVDESVPAREWIRSGLRP